MNNDHKQNSCADNEAAQDEIEQECSSHDGEADLSNSSQRGIR